MNLPWMSLWGNEGEGLSFLLRDGKALLLAGGFSAANLNTEGTWGSGYENNVAVSICLSNTQSHFQTFLANLPGYTPCDHAAVISSSSKSTITRLLGAG